MNSTTETGREEKSSTELKADVDAAIAKVDQDLDALRTEMTPGRIIDDAILRGRRNDLRTTVNHLRNNPIGTTFLGLGTLLLMEDEGHISGEDRLRHFAQHSASIAQEAAQKAREVSEDVGKKTKEKLEEAKSVVAEKVDSIKATTGEALEDVKNAAPEAERLGQQARDMASKLASPEYRPVAIAALGLGLGTVLGSSLPPEPSSAQQEAVDINASEIANEVQRALKESSRRFLGILADELTEKTFH